MSMMWGMPSSRSANLFIVQLRFPQKREDDAKESYAGSITARNQMVARNNIYVRHVMDWRENMSFVFHLLRRCAR
jgi:hypothetical protein